MSDEWTHGGWVEIGSGHRYRMAYLDGVAYAIDEVHPGPAGMPCAGWIPFTGRGAHSVTWELESEAPLTLSPSLLCSCGEHGYIRSDTWEKC